MKDKIKRFFLRLNLFGFIRWLNLFSSYNNWREHRCKQEILLALKKKYDLNTFVETGTYLGDMVYAMRNNFKKIYSIELDKDLCDRAANRFRKNDNIAILAGSSNELLLGVISSITEPALFWLDAHYSAGITAKGSLDTPIMKELEIILGQRIHDHVIVIDDFASFNGSNDYPTFDKLKKHIHDLRGNYKVVTDGKVIEIFP